jgi:hypothetical protein
VAPASWYHAIGFTANGARVACEETVRRASPTCGAIDRACGLGLLAPSARSPVPA